MRTRFSCVVYAGFTVETEAVLPHIQFQTDPLTGGLESCSPLLSLRSVIA